MAAKRKSGGTDGSESKKARKVIQASIGIESVFFVLCRTHRRTSAFGGPSFATSRVKSELLGLP